MSSSITDEDATGNKVQSCARNSKNLADNWAGEVWHNLNGPKKRKFPTKDQLRKETCSALCLCWMNIGRSFGSGSGKNWKSIDILLRE